jgi:hypothetical protein
MGSADVKHEILSKSEIECLGCRLVGRVADFGRFYSDRAGLIIVDCECRLCNTKWRRIVIGGEAA